MGGGGRAMKRRRRAIVESDSDSGDEGQERGARAGEGAGVQAVLTVGRLAESDGAGDGADGERHRAAVAAARRRLGGGGKRGWLA